MPKGNDLMLQLTAHYYSSVLPILNGLCACVNGQKSHGQELIFHFFFLPNNININWNIIRFTATVVIFSLVLTQPPMWFKVQNAHLPDESYVGVLLYYVNCTNCKTHTVFYFFLLLHLSSNMRMHVDWNFVYVSIFSHIMFVSRERQCNIPTKQQQGSDKMIHNTMHIITGRLVLGGTGELLCRTR